MAKGYWIARVDVMDEEGYKPYAAANAAIFKNFNARFIVRGGKYEAPEGTPRTRNVVIEFPDLATAQARDIGVDGLVCSAEEAAKLRGIVKPGMALVTPGIRPAGSASGDQKRIMTPAAAIAAGADYLVVGRPIVEAADPKAAAEAIVAEIAEAKK